MESLPDDSIRVSDQLAAMLTLMHFRFLSPALYCRSREDILRKSFCNAGKSTRSFWDAWYQLFPFLNDNVDRSPWLFILMHRASNRTPAMLFVAILETLGIIGWVVDSLGTVFIIGVHLHLVTTTWVIWMDNMSAIA